MHGDAAFHEARLPSLPRPRRPRALRRAPVAERIEPLARVGEVRAPRRPAYERYTETLSSRRTD